MREHGLTGENGASLLRPVADRDYKVPVLALQSVHASWRVARPRNVEIAQSLQRERMDASRRLGARACGFEAFLALRAQDGVGHLTAGRVPRTKEEQPEPLHAGLRARINAPMVRPPTSRASSN